MIDLDFLALIVRIGYRVIFQLKKSLVPGPHMVEGGTVLSSPSIKCK